MEFTKVKNNGVLTVAVRGHLDTNTAPVFESGLKGELSDITELRLDLTNLVYISSAGLRALLTLHKAMVAKKGKLVLLHPNEEVMEILDMTGFSTFLNIEH